MTFVPARRLGNVVLTAKHSVDAWVRCHVRAAQRALALLGVALIAASILVAFGGPDGTSRLAQVPPTPPSPVAAPAWHAVRPPPPDSSSATTPTHHSTAKFRCAPGADHGAGGAVPVRICIPAIGVQADVMQVGLNPDHTIEVPPLSEVGTAAWYKYSPAPGVLGPSIILGHIDSAQAGKGVFYDLGRLHVGDRISLLRADGMVAMFRVDKVAEYPKSAFPTQAVYGNTNRPAIRLITCGGPFDPSAGSYLDNIVAFGTLVSLTRA